MDEELKQALIPIAQYLISNHEIEWHLEDNICDMGDDGDGYVAYPVKEKVLDFMPEVFVDDDWQNELEDVILGELTDD